MVTFRITYASKISKISDKARIAIDLKRIYWQNRKLPEDWYLFEGNVNIKSVSNSLYDRVIIECKHELNEWSSPIYGTLKKYPYINAIEYAQSDDFFITMFCR